ncbi:CHAP domain-containing protein [Laedolimicola intestinihominis]|uniref:CHAP domain-containing protein n=1 Tax=Laedolimicola intestinihominis TaxID=3133166 RepID=A0ABV1FHX6_9FIRM
MNKEPRLRFTDEERADPALEKPIRKTEKATARADKAQANIPKIKVRQTVIDPDTGKKTSKLTFEDKKKPPSKLSQGVKEAPVHLVAGKFHKEIRETEQDNVGVESAHKSEEAVETSAYLVREGYRSHKLKPYRKAAQAEQKLEKANVNALYQKSLRENPQFTSNPLSRWQQKQSIKKQYAVAKRTGQTAGNTAQAASKTGKAARTVKEKAQQAGAFVMRHKKGFLMAGVFFLIACMLMNTMSSCSMMAQSIGSVISGTTYPSDDPEMLAVEADYADREARLQEKIDNIESSHPGYDEYRYNLGMIGHDPHELAAFLSAVLQGYTRHSAQAELERVFDAQYQLTLREEIQIRTYTDEDGDEHEYEYRILHVTLTSRSIVSLAPELLTPEQMEMYQVYRQTMGNKPLLFGGGSPDTGVSEDLTGVEFINGTRPGNPQLVELAKSQVGNVGGQPYWSWYGFDSRVEWCACFVSWCYGQSGRTEPRFAGCQSQGVPWFQSHGQWGARGYENIAPGDAIFFDWDLDGSADHVGIVVGTDGSRVYTVEGNSGDACKIKSYDLNYQSIKGYGLMNW